MSTDSPPEPIDAWVGDLLLDLHHGARVALPEFAHVVSARRGGQDVSHLRGRLSPVEDSLELLVEGADLDAFNDLAKELSVRNTTVLFDLADDTQLHAGLMNMNSVSFGTDPGGVVGHGELHHWRWRSAREAKAWIGTLDGYLPPRFGNLTLSQEGPRFSTRSPFRLIGQNDWYLLPVKDAKPVVVLVLNGDDDSIADDLICLEFVFGRPFALDYVVGIDEDREVVAGRSVRRFGARQRKGRSPVPDWFTQEPLWIPMLFERLAATVRSSGIRGLLPGMGAYIDVQSAHLDAGYLLAHIGLEALLANVALPEDHRTMVRSKDGWGEEMKKLRGLVGQHVVEDDDVDLILGRLAGAPRPPIRRVLDRYFARAGITLPKDVRKELQGRNTAAHSYWMNPDENYEVDRDYGRIELVLTVLTAVLALHVGYRGPIRGYNVASDGTRPSPEWWPVAQDVQTSARSFIHRRNETTASGSGGA